MAAVYHILQRYMEYGFTSRDALLKLLMDEELIFSNEEILVGSEKLELVHPAVSFELKYEVEGGRTEKDIKSNLQEVLDNFMKEENALLWMNQEYERVRCDFDWQPLVVSTEDLKKVDRISVDNVWYGGGHHEKVTVEFNYEKYNNAHEIPIEEKARLNQLKDFFQLVLENVYQLVPTDEEFVWNGKTWESNAKPDDKEKHDTYEFRVRQLCQGMKSNPNVREATASVFTSLGDKGVKYNTAVKILELLERESDVDNLTIRVQKAKKGRPVSVTNSGPIFICPKMKTRLKDLPKEVSQNVHQLLSRVLLAKDLSNKEHEELFDILINVNNPSLFEMDDRPGLGQKINEFKSSKRSLVACILNKYRDENGTLGGLIDAFRAIKEDQSDEDKYVRAMNDLVEGMEDIAQRARDLSEEQAQKQFAKDRSLKTFVKFLKDHQPHGMKKYAEAKGYEREQFLKFASEHKVLPGDMIGFYRKNLRLDYAHAGIYAPFADGKYVVHIQPEEGKWLKGAQKKAQVSCDDLEKVLAKDDKAFYIRECEDSKAQIEVLCRVEACLFEEPIKYSYNCHFGSCQTFCSRVLGSSLFDDLNPEAFLTTASGMKAWAGWFLGGEANSEDLLEKMKKRLEKKSTYDTSELEVDLMKTYPKDSQLGRSFLFTRQGSLRIYADLCVANKFTNSEN